MQNGRSRTGKGKAAGNVDVDAVEEGGRAAVDGSGSDESSGEVCDDTVVTAEPEFAVVVVALGADDAAAGAVDDAAAGAVDDAAAGAVDDAVDVATNSADDNPTDGCANDAVDDTANGETEEVKQCLGMNAGILTFKRLRLRSFSSGSGSCRRGDEIVGVCKRGDA